MADTVQINIGADVGGAVGSIDQLKAAIAGVNEPLTAIRSASVGAADAHEQEMSRMITETLAATRAVQQIDAAYVEAYKNNMRVLVDQKRITLQQALSLDADYSSEIFGQERQRLEAIIEGDRATIDQRLLAYAQLAQADARYAAQSTQEYRRIADQAHAQAEQVARSFEQAFDRVGGSLQHTFNDILTGQTTWAKGAMQMVQQVETFFLDEVEKMALKWAASGLADMAGGAVATAVTGAQATGATGIGAGLAALVGVNQPGGLFGTGLMAGSAGAATGVEAANTAANTTALGASTAAITALTAAMAGTTAAEGASAGASLAGGGAAAAGAAAGGGGIFSWLGGLCAFARGGIVPSAAGGWALPNFAGATPALLHAREMVLPADISQGLQGMIAQGGAGDAHFHAHFHGPADAPAISRWFRDNLRSNAGAVRDLFRQNALTPRGL
ncbi:MAG TPA: hypothetical protein VET89_11455 [Stellaceae bacterium]|nr:hypothetical protein [Stellaceae bacterium]